VIVNTFHDARIDDKVLVLEAFLGKHPDIGDMTARGVIPLRNIVFYESAPKKFDTGPTGWEEGSIYWIHLIDGRHVELDFAVHTRGDESEGVTGDAGQAFVDFDEAMQRALAAP